MNITVKSDFCREVELLRRAARIEEKLEEMIRREDDDLMTNEN